MTLVKIIKEASAEEGSVLNTDDIKHLTGGLGLSSGFVIISRDEAIYIPNDIQDKQVTLDKINETLDKVKDTLENLVSIVQDIGSTISITPAINGSPLDPAFTASVVTPFVNTITILQDDIDDLKDSVTGAKEDLK